MILENQNFITIGDYYLIKIPKDAYNIDVTTSGMLWFNRTTHTARRYFYLPSNFAVTKTVIGRSDTMLIEELRECGLTDVTFNSVYLVCKKVDYQSDLKIILNSNEFILNNIRIQKSPVMKLKGSIKIIFDDDNNIVDCIKL